MGRLTFGLIVTLVVCCDHREMIADDEMHDYFTQLIGAAGAMLFGRKTYELM
ncbi:MAG: dihydrofolate reductase family protein, partial [Steroidobacteraceae bacterium]